MAEASALWRRLDTPGHDACRLARERDGWHLQGSATFLQDGALATLEYSVGCDTEWITRDGQVHGHVGDETPFDLTIVRLANGTWTLNGTLVPEVDGCADLDLGFTPATNLLPLRRLALLVGGSAEVTSAWLDVSSLTLEPLTQRYERQTEDAYWYEAPRFGYAALLEVAPSGFVRRYPGLWESE